MKTNMSQAINITIPKELLKRVDALAKREYTSRSDIIRQALLDIIRKPIEDEWGDSGDWTTLIDFREIRSGGVSSKDLLEAINKLEKDQPDKYGR